MFYHNMETCIGCGACQTACKDHNNLSTGNFFRRVAEITLSDGRKRFFSGSCNHCEKPACVAVCPNGAFYIASDGLVLHDDGKCVGCGRCVWACPYGSVSLNLERGVAQKCLGCGDYGRRGEEPPCVAACVNRSLKLADNDGGCKDARVRSTIAGVLPSDAITQPKLKIYLDTGEVGK